MKRMMLVLAALLVLTVSVPSFADGNPQPHSPTGPRCTVSGCTV